MIHLHINTKWKLLYQCHTISILCDSYQLKFLNFSRKVRKFSLKKKRSEDEMVTSISPLHSCIQSSNRAFHNGNKISSDGSRIGPWQIARKNRPFFDRAQCILKEICVCLRSITRNQVFLLLFRDADYLTGIL